MVIQSVQLIEQAEQTAVVAGKIAGPALFLQFADQRASDLITDGHIHQTNPQGIGDVQPGAGQPQEQTGASRQPVQEMTGSDIREQADADFRHGQGQICCGQPVAAAGKQTQAAAHGDTVGQTQYRLREAVNAVIQPVFSGEETDGGIPVFFAGECAVQVADIAAGAEGPVAASLQYHQADAWIFRPPVQGLLHLFHHVEGQGVQRRRGVQDDLA